MKSIVLLLLSLMPVSSFANSAPAEQIIDASSSEFLVQANSDVSPITESSIKLLGRGLTNRKTHETLALVCIQQNCSSLRMAYFSPNGKLAYYFGSTIEVTADGSNPTDEQTHLALKALFKTYKQNRAYAGEKRTQHTIQGVGGAVGLTILMTATAGPMGTIVALSAFAVSAAALIALNQTSFIASPITASFNNVDGWNWSSQAKKISDRNFNLMISVKNGSGDRSNNINYYRSID